MVNEHVILELLFFLLIFLLHTNLTDTNLNIYTHKTQVFDDWESQQGFILEVWWDGNWEHPQRFYPKTRRSR